MADGAPQAAVKKRMLRIASGCATREAFISVFRRFCDRDSIFIATRTPKAAGADLNFSITLADGAPLIGGTGTVLESWSDETSPYGRAGMRIRFDQLTPSGRALLDELVAAAKASDESKPAVPVPGAAAALAALAKAGPPPTTPSAKPPAVPTIKPLPSVIPKPIDPRKTMLGMTPLKRPPRLEATPAPVAIPQIARDVEMKLPALPPRARSTPGPDDSDDQTTGVAARFTPDSSSTFVDEASWDEAASHVLGSTRAKGSDLVLPANPLGGVDGESLDAFVECTLYEETGTFRTDTEATAPGPAAPDDYDEDDLTIPPWLQGPVADSPFAQSIAVPPPLLPFDADPRPADKPPSSDLRARLVDAGKAFDPARVPTAERAASGRRRSHWPLTIAIAAVTGACGVAIGAFALELGQADDGDGDGASAARAVEPPASAAAPPPAAASDVIAAAPSDVIAQPPPEPEPEPEPAAAAAGDEKVDPEPPPPPAAEEPGAAIEFSRLAGKLKKDRCGAEIKTRPDDAAVYIGDTRLGATPLKVVLPCGEHALELRRPRYTQVQKSIALEEGKLEKLELNLARPEHRLRITSAPSGAAVTVNGRAAGTTPAAVTVNGFEQARITVSLAGYKDWSTKIYVRDPTTSVSAKLAADKAPAQPRPSARSKRSQ